MKRFKVTIEYDGTNFFGWQKQEGLPTIEGFLSDVVEKFAGKPTQLFASGRTDSGVHALGQVVHFDIEKDLSAKDVKDAINFYMRPIAPIAAVAAEEVDSEFHARFSSKLRYYQYRIHNRREHLVMDRLYAWQVKKKLDEKAMSEAAKYLLGTHDFTSFRATECQAQSPVKTIDSLEVRREGEMIFIDIAAKSFLHHMVRNIAGSLRQVGSGKWQPGEIKKVLESRNRAAAGQTAPPSGLFFMKVDY